MRRLLLMLLVLGCARSVSAANYYVSLTTNSPAGDDSRSCGTATTVTSPKATITNAMNCLSAGDTLYVRGGTYAEAIYWPGTNGTSASGGSITVKAYPSGCGVGVSPSCETVWVRPSSQPSHAGRVFWVEFGKYLVFDGINLDAANAFSDGVIQIGSVNESSRTDANHVTFKNAEITVPFEHLGGSAAVNVNSDDNNFQYLTIHGGGISGSCGYTCNSYGIYFAGHRNLAEHNNIYNVTGQGLQIYCNSSHVNCRVSGVFSAPHDNIVRSNYIHDITLTEAPGEFYGMLIAGNSNYIYNNIVDTVNDGSTTTVGNAGITIGDGFNTNLIANNTIYNVRYDGIYIGAGTGNIIRNNIIYQQIRNAITNAGSSTTLSNNMSSGVNPLFTDGPNGDFTLTGSSTAIDAGYGGTDVTSVFTTDYSGSNRPAGAAWDIGAYEYGGSITPPGCTPASTSPTRLTDATGSICDLNGVTWAIGTGSSPNYTILMNSLVVTTAGSPYTDDFAGATGGLPSPPWKDIRTGQAMKRDGFGHAVATNLNQDTWVIYTSTTTNDQYAQIQPQFTGPGDATKYIFLIVRSSNVGNDYNAGSGYVLWSDGGSDTSLWKYTAGVSTLTRLSVDNAFTFASGDTLKLEAIGSALKVYKNGTVDSTLNATDSTLTTGYPGFGLLGNTAVTADNWQSPNAAVNFTGSELLFCTGQTYGPVFAHATNTLWYGWNGSSFSDYANAADPCPVISPTGGMTNVFLAKFGLIR